MSVLNYYSLLHVSSSSTIDEIRKSYKELIKQWHPDAFTEENTLAELMTRQLNEAYEVLMNPDLRNKYDMTLKLQGHEKKTRSAYAQQVTRSYSKHQGATKIVTPSYPNTDEQLKKEEQIKEMEIISSWMTKVSRYLSEHTWAENVFEHLPEDMKLRVMGGNLSFKDAFTIYCKLQMKKVSMGLKTPYFNQKTIEKSMGISNTTEEMRISMEVLSREETLIQINLRANAGLFKGLKLSTYETDTILKLGKLHAFLNKRPDEFFIGANKFSVSIPEWNLAKELSSIGVKDGKKI